MQNPASVCGVVDYGLNVRAPTTQVGDLNESCGTAQHGPALAIVVN